MQSVKLSLLKTMLLSIAGIVFLILVIMLGYHNRLASDDYDFLHSVKIYGIWGGMVHWYHVWNARWTAILLLNIFLKYTTGQTLLLYSLFTLISLIFSVYLLFSSFILTFLKR